jgi:IrrE N-terminal-like domain
MYKFRRAVDPFSAALCKIYGCSNPRRIVKWMANDLFMSVGQPGPPFSPFEYARALGLKIEYRPVQAEGIFVDDPTEGARIVLPPPEHGMTASGRRRLNFTVAHEIAHFVIRRTLTDVVPLSTLKLRSGSSEEEQLCNAFAAELLMPASKIRHELSPQKLDPEAILRLSERFDVSVKALLCRARDFFPDAVQSIIWASADGRISPDWATPSSLRGVLLCDTGHTTVERALESCNSEFGRDHFLLAGKSMWRECVSKCLPGGRKILTIMGRLELRKCRFELRKKTTTQTVAIRLPVQQFLPFE